MKSAHPSIAARILLSVLVVHLAACSAMRTVSVESAMRQSPPPGIRHGSLVEIRTLDRKTVRFRVTEMNDQGLGGQMGFFRFEDMQSLKVEGSSRDGTEAAAAILGVLGVAALIWLVANADSVAVCSPSPCPTPDP